MAPRYLWCGEGRLPSAGLVVVLAMAGCGAADHSATLARLREAIHAEIASEVQLEDHNQLVENVVSSGALEGLRTYEVEERLGRGQECGTRDICREHDFRENDWVYEVGREPGQPDVAAGPTLIVGFDSRGAVQRTYYLTRR